MTRALPPLEVLRDLFAYDQETGVVTRRKSIRGKGSFKGAAAAIARALAAGMLHGEFARAA